VCYIEKNYGKRGTPVLEYKFDTQLLLENGGLSEDAIYDWIVENLEGDCLLVVGDESLIKLHYHTNAPWRVLEYCASLGEIHDIVVENMEMQADGLHG
jgi:dihydroxyacetone kinase-like predicted kinase